MTIRAMITERLDGWRYQWGNFEDKADEVELFENTHETFAKAHAELLKSIREQNPVGSLQGDEPEGKENVKKSGKRKPKTT